MKFEFEIPLKATHTQNSRVHWSKGARARRKERDAVELAFPKDQVRPLVLITLTRFGPKELDEVNLQASLKGVQDEVARQLGIDDRSRIAAWLFAQLPGEYSVRVSVAFADPPAEWMNVAQREEWATLRARAAQPRKFAGRLSSATYRPGGKP